MIIFLHWLGWAVWLGAQATFMVWGTTAKRTPLASWAYTWDTLARVQSWIVAPGCAIATLTGIVLSMQYAGKPDVSMGAPWLIVMQVLGLVAAVLTLALATPLVNRMAYLAARSVETGTLDPRAEPVRKRLGLTLWISGAFILVTVYFSAVKP